MKVNSLGDTLKSQNAAGFACTPTPHPPTPVCLLSQCCRPFTWHQHQAALWSQAVPSAS